MILSRSIRGALAVVLVAAPAAAQQAPEPAVRGPEGPLWESHRRASEIFWRGVEAHGGVDALRALRGVAYRMQGSDFAPTQGRVPTLAWEREGNERPWTLEARIELTRPRFLIERRSAFPGGVRSAFRLAGRDGELVSYDPYPGGLAGTVFSRDTTGTAFRRVLASQGTAHPVLLLRRALDRTLTLRYLGPVVREGRREEGISFADGEGTVFTLFFDAETGLLTSREVIGEGSLGDEIDATRYLDYARIDGLMVPGAMKESWNGYPAVSARFEDFSVQVELPDSLFGPPVGYAAATPGGAMELVPVAEGVWFMERVGGSYRSLVVDVGEGLLVVDAPVSRAASEAAAARIEAALPDRPIRWVAVTHHHADHIAGLAVFAARGATILAAPGSEEYLRRMAGVRRTLGRPGGVPHATVEPVIETVRGRRVFGRGARRVEVLDVGPTSHASAMLAVYLPGEGLLFQGDLLRLNEHGGPAASPESTRDLEGIIRRLGLRVRTIGAVHGRNGTLDDLREALRAGGAP